MQIDLPNFEARTPSRANIASALTIGTIALLVIGVQPILLGTMVEARSATLSGVGIIAMCEIVALGLGIVVCDALMSLSHLRFISIAAALFVAALDVATTFVTGDAHLAVVRSAAGLGEGALMWVTTCIIVRSQVPDRIAGIFLVTQALAQAALAVIFAGLVVPRAGWHGGFVMLAAVSLVPCIAIAWLPARLAPLATQTLDKFRWSVIAALPLAVALLQLAAIGAIWAYLEPLGKRAGFGAQAAQTLTAGVQLMQVLGGTTASVAVRVPGKVRTLVVGALALAAIPFAMHGLPAAATLRFTLLCAAFGFVWMFLMPFHVSLAFLADPTGRAAMLIPAMQLLGSALGPLVASFVVTGEDAAAVLIVSLSFALAAVALLVLGYFRFREKGSPVAS
jgi:MFS transporter, DHA1 family, inner membrane transport protein